MKRIFLAISFTLVAFGWTSCNQDDKEKDDLQSSDIPAAVQSAFTSKYPSASEIKWEKAKEDGKPTYKAKFKSGDKKIKAEFGEDGGFIQDKADE